MTARAPVIQGLPGSCRDALATGEVHLWAERHDSDRNPPAADLLSADERARAARLVREIDRGRFINSHAFMRRVLARYLGVAPQEVAFEVGPWGKPRVANPQPAGPIEFSLSHAADVTLLGVAAGFPVGADVEAIRDMDDHERLAESFFAGSESAALQRVPAPARLRAFFEFWTVKEAIVKALGTGLSTPLHTFEVTLGPVPAVNGIALDDAGYPGEQWSVMLAEPFAGFIGAAAVPWTGATFRWMDMASC